MIISLEPYADPDGPYFKYFNKMIDKKTVIELFKNAGIELSFTNISSTLIDEVINNKEMYLSLEKRGFYKTFKKKY